MQALCLRLPQRAFSRSELYARRLREEHLNGTVTVVEGAYEGDGEVHLAPGARPDVVVFAGRHIPEKRAGTIVPAVVARQRLPSLRAVIFGDGPERPAILEAVAEAGIQEAVDVPGFVERERIDRCLEASLAMILPSSREGLGMVVVEAASRGTPSIVVAGPDNASSELVEDGTNGVIAPSASAEDLAAAIVRVREGGEDLGQSTPSGSRQRNRLSLGRSPTASPRATGGGARTKVASVPRAARSHVNRPARAGPAAASRSAADRSTRRSSSAAAIESTSSGSK